MIYIDVVIVTFNRLEKLKHTLSCYENQTIGFRNLIVVDNHSNDGTVEYLKEWQNSASDRFEKHVLFLKSNTGGSGGFYEGQKYAMSLSPDWVFLADDDAYPCSDLFEKFSNYVSTNDTSDISAICSVVRHVDMSIDLEHRDMIKKPTVLKFKRFSAPIECYENSTFEIDFLSYVGSFIKADAIDKVGMVNKNFFIYYDDSEHSLRLHKYGKIICLTNIYMIHDCGFTSESSDVVTWRTYYVFRNYNYTLKQHYPLQFALIVIKTYAVTLFAYLNRSKSDLWPWHKVRVVALNDAIRGKLGIHDVIKPGWSHKKIK